MSTVYTAEEVAEQLRVHRYTIYRAIRSGQLEALRVGREIRVTPDALQTFTRLQPKPKKRRKQEAQKC